MKYNFPFQLSMISQIAPILMVESHPIVALIDFSSVFFQKSDFFSYFLDPHCFHGILWQRV